MSGHSKWSQIKRQKGVADAKRGQIFTKLGHELTVATKQGGGPDPETNFRLRLAIQRAKENNMPAENIQRAIRRASGEEGAGSLEEVTYEGYGPGGTAIIVQSVTDNRNRTVSEIRNAFSRAGGNLGESGSVAWQFENRGVITLTPNGKDPDEIVLLAIDAGAADVQTDEDEGSIEVYTEPQDLEAVRRALEDEHKLKVESFELTMAPKTSVRLEEKEALQALRLIDRLEELEDVQKVYFNGDFDASVLEKAES